MPQRRVLGNTHAWEEHRFRSKSPARLLERLVFEDYYNKFKNSPLSSNLPKSDKEVTDEEYAVIRRTPIAPLMYIFGVFGTFPVRIKQPLIPDKRLTRSTALYCYLMFCGLLYSAIIVVREYTPRLLGDGSVEEKVYLIQNLSVMFVLIAVPLSWFETDMLTHVVRGTAKFHMLYQSITSRDIDWTWHRRVSWFCCGCILISNNVYVLIIFISMKFLSFRLVYLPVYMYGGTLNLIMTFLFYIHHHEMCTAAKHTLVYFKELLERDGTGPTARDIREVRQLWTTLRELDNDGECRNVLHVINIMYIFIMLTMAIFKIIISPNKADIFNINAVGVLDLGIQVYIMCEITYHRHQLLRDPFITTLDRASAKVTGIEEMREVSLFYRTVTAKSPSPVLGGFSDMGREFIPSILHAAITYFVALVQFWQVDTSAVSEIL